MSQHHLSGLDAVLFDLDGTLWDSTVGVAASWTRGLQRLAPGLREPITDLEFRSCMGLRIPDIGAKLFPMLRGECRERLIKACLEEEEEWLRSAGGVVYDGVEDTLAALSRDYSLGLVSNCQQGYIENFFRLTGLGRFFNDHESYGATGLRKADNLRLVVERNNFKRACYVGDMHIDRDAAAGAGLPFVYCRYGFGDLPDCQYNIDCFSQLLDILR